MRLLLILICVFTTITMQAQLKVPAGFVYVAGDNPSGRDAYYKSGNYILYEDAPFQSGEDPATDQAMKNYLKSYYGVAFTKTSDGLFYGTGLSNQRYWYIVVSGAFAYILSATENGTVFSNYSSWLLKSIRDAINNGKQLYFTAK